MQIEQCAGKMPTGLWPAGPKILQVVLFRTLRIGWNNISKLISSTRV